MYVDGHMGRNPPISLPLSLPSDAFFCVSSLAPALRTVSSCLFLPDGYRAEPPRDDGQSTTTRTTTTAVVHITHTSTQAADPGGRLRSAGKGEERRQGQERTQTHRQNGHGPPWTRGKCKVVAGENAACRATMLRRVAREEVAAPAASRAGGLVG